MEFINVKKILVIKLRHIGDVLLTVPVFRALKEHFPGVRITALVNSGTEDVLEGNPLIDEIIVFNRAIKGMNPVRKLMRELSFFKMIRAKGFDLSVDLTSGDRAANISLVSRARYRFAYDPGKDGYPGKRLLYTHRAIRDPRKHMVLQNLDVIKQFGISTDDLSVDIFIPENAQLFIKNLFKENNIQDGHKVVHIHPTSRWLFKCWADDYMAEVITWLLNSDVRVAITSSPDKREIEKTRKILSLCTPNKSDPSMLIDLCGKTTIKQLAALSRSSDAFFGVDSAPMHIAAAVGTPVVALFGPTGAFNWAPWYSKGDKNPHTVIKRERGCSQCSASRCEYDTCKYLNDITPEEIKRVLRDIVL